MTENALKQSYFKSRFLKNAKAPKFFNVFPYFYVAVRQLNSLFKNEASFLISASKNFWQNYWKNSAKLFGSRSNQKSGFIFKQAIQLSNSSYKNKHGKKLKNVGALTFFEKTRFEIHGCFNAFLKFFWT